MPPPHFHAPKPANPPLNKPIDSLLPCNILIHLSMLYWCIMQTAFQNSFCLKSFVLRKYFCHMPKQKVIIIGAGLSGSLMAIYLAKKGIECEIYESRGDMRTAAMAVGRSINLALSNRGIAALKEVGLDEFMLAEAVPMYGRMIQSAA